MTFAKQETLFSKMVQLVSVVIGKGQIQNKFVATRLVSVLLHVYDFLAYNNLG